MSANNAKASETLNIFWSKLQHKQHQQINDQDAAIDLELGMLSEEVEGLKEIALQQSAEVKKHRTLLDNASKNKMDPAVEHMTQVNSKMDILL